MHCEVSDFRKKRGKRKFIPTYMFYNTIYCFLTMLPKMGISARLVTLNFFFRVLLSICLKWSIAGTNHLVFRVTSHLPKMISKLRFSSRQMCNILLAYHKWGVRVTRHPMIRVLSRGYEWVFLDLYKPNTIHTQDLWLLLLSSIYLQACALCDGYIKITRLLFKWCIRQK